MFTTCGENTVVLHIGLSIQCCRCGEGLLGLVIRNKNIEQREKDIETTIHGNSEQVVYTFVGEPMGVSFCFLHTYAANVGYDGPEPAGHPDSACLCTTSGGGKLVSLPREEKNNNTVSE